MNRFVLCFWLACSAFSGAFGHEPEYANPVIDSLQSELNFAADSAKVDLYNKLAYNYYYYLLDSADSYIKKSLDLATYLKYIRGLSEAQRLKGIVYKARNNEKEAIKWLYKGLHSAESINYHQGIADNLNSIGIFYFSVEDYPQANDYFKRSIMHQILAKNRLREGILYSNTGVIYLKMNELDSSAQLFLKSKAILDSIGDKRWIAMINSQYAALLIKTKDYHGAEALCHKAIELGLKTGQTRHLRKSYQNLAEIYLEQKLYAKGEEMAEKALELSLKIGYFPYLVEAYKVSYQISKERNNIISALGFHEKFASYQDSLQLHQIKSGGNLQEYKLMLEQKEQENKYLRSETEEQEAQINVKENIIKRQYTIGIVFVIALMIVSILIVIFIRLRQKDQDANAKLSNANAELEEQKEELSATLQMVEHLNAQLQAQNNTLNKIAIASITDLNGNIINVNDNFCGVTGYEREELLGNNHSILNSGEHPPQVFSELWQTITGGDTWRGELKNKKKDGSFFWCDTAIAPILNDDGKPKQFYSLQFDITERHGYLDQLASKSHELEELNKLKDKLLSIISHDFRGPLNSLRGTLTLFFSGSISNEELKILAKGLVEKLDNTYSLLDNLLNWAKSQIQDTKVYIKTINLQDIAKDCTSLLAPIAEAKLVNLINQITAPVHAKADNEMVKLVIRNLISNAIKFCDAGREIVLNAEEDMDFVTISVKDNGVGISNENQNKIFSPENVSTYGTSNEKGMGIGLLLCKDLVEKNGGKIWFESELEKGSIFYFTLPVSSGENS